MMVFIFWVQHTKSIGIKPIQNIKTFTEVQDGLEIFINKKVFFTL
jgi:hypothetical protein